jgi:hypothetical protein
MKKKKNRGVAATPLGPWGGSATPLFFFFFFLNFNIFYF